MRFKIHHKVDEIVVEGNSAEDIRVIVNIELEKRGWKEDDCWSEEVK